MINLIVDPDEESGHSEAEHEHHHSDATEVHANRFVVEIDVHVLAHQPPCLHIGGLLQVQLFLVPNILEELRNLLRFRFLLILRVVFYQDLSQSVPVLLRPHLELRLLCEGREHQEAICVEVHVGSGHNEGGGQDKPVEGRLHHAHNPGQEEHTVPPEIIFRILVLFVRLVQLDMLLVRSLIVSSSEAVQSNFHGVDEVRCQLQLPVHAVPQGPLQVSQANTNAECGDHDQAP
mmetsp:Transcript_4606/g.10846  ORF Transcript_4606/g.10846 Transcript_4606/m.10846 type:complete len:233 (+) Transcript_4606:404-1102(+)